MENPNQLPQKLDPKEERKNVEFIGKNMIIRKCLLQMPEPKLRILSTLYGISDGRKVQRHRPVRTLHKIHWSSTAVQLLSTRSLKIHSIPWFFHDKIYKADNILLFPQYTPITNVMFSKIVRTLDPITSILTDTRVPLAK